MGDLLLSFVYSDAGRGATEEVTIMVLLKLCDIVVTGMTHGVTSAGTWRGTCGIG